MYAITWTCSNIIEQQTLNSRNQWKQFTVSQWIYNTYMFLSICECIVFLMIERLFFKYFMRIVCYHHNSAMYVYISKIIRIASSEISLQYYINPSRPKLTNTHTHTPIVILADWFTLFWTLNVSYYCWHWLVYIAHCTILMIVLSRLVSPRLIVTSAQSFTVHFFFFSTFCELGSKSKKFNKTMP